MTSSSVVRSVAHTLGHDDLLALDLGEHQPAVIPASAAARILGGLPLGLVQALGAERIILRQPPELVQEIVRVDIIGPGRRHGRRHIGRIERSKNTFDAAQLRQGVDAVSTKRLH